MRGMESSDNQRSCLDNLHNSVKHVDNSKGDWYCDINSGKNKLNNKIVKNLVKNKIVAENVKNKYATMRASQLRI